MSNLYRKECHRAAQRAIWAWKWRVWRHHLVFWSAFILAAAAAIYALLGLALWAAERRAPKPRWTGQVWECPAPYDVYADEHDARAGRNYVYCVK